MSTFLRFRDHERFHGTAGRMVLTGGAVGGLGHALWGDVGAAPSLAMLSGATLVAAVTTPRRSREVCEAVALAITAAALLAALSSLVPAHWRLVAGGLAVAVCAATWRPQGARWLWLIALVGAGFGLAPGVAAALAGGRELASLPAWLGAALAGGGFALTAVFALLPRHVERVRDRVAVAHAGLVRRVGGELGELVERAYREWQCAARGLPEEDAHRRVLEEAVLRLFEVAGRWSAIEADGSRPRAEVLVERLEALDRRCQAAGDEVVREQYRQARAALAEQLRHLREIDTSRDRLVARMHNYVAAMERLRMAVVNLHSADVSRSADEVAPMVSTLERLGQDMDCTAVAAAEVDQLCPGAPPVRPLSATIAEGGGP